MLLSRAVDIRKWKRQPWGGLQLGLSALLTFLLLFLSVVQSPAQETAVAETSSESPAVAEGESFTNDLGMKFVWIPAGTFMMGSPEKENGRNDDEAKHKVRLSSGFFLQTREVTQKQWRAVMGENPAKFKDCGGNCPVEKVSWYDVQAFIYRLKEQTGRNYRLPTEAEWEYACRAGSRTRYSWGNSINCAQANYGYGYSEECSGDNPGHTMPAASFSANPWGLYDMHGNVYEWCADWYTDVYPSETVTDPTGPSAGERRVFRGGSWSGDGAHCRSANRGACSPGMGIIIVGFRLALSADQ